MDTESFRKYGHEFVDWVADYLRDIEKHPVLSRVKPGEIKSKIPLSPPEESENMDEIFADFKRVILPGITHWQHPSFFAYFPANSSGPSVLAELLTAGLGAQCMVWQTSPAGTELEEIVMGWLRQMIGLPECFTGVIQDTASTSTLCALLSAREKATASSINARGFSEKKDGRLVVYASKEVHSSIEKGAKIAGLGRENVRLIPVGEDFAMIPEALEEAIEKDIAARRRPCCAIATLGTTSSTAMDPLEPIGQICSRHGVWLHVDAAMAGTAAILPEMRHILQGVKLADSFVFNPHKWMFTNFDCSAYFCQDPSHLISTFEITPEYLKTDADRQVKNFRDWGIPLGRRFRALKLWFVIRHFGVKGLQEKIRLHLDLAREFAGWVHGDSRFELVAPVSLNLVCFRFNPRGRLLAESELERINRELIEDLNRSGRLFLTHTKLNGKFTLRLCIGQTHTERRHVVHAWERIQNSEALAAHDLD